MGKPVRGEEWQHFEKKVNVSGWHVTVRFSRPRPKSLVSDQGEQDNFLSSPEGAIIPGDSSLSG